jgi:hypothetical protein
MPRPREGSVRFTQFLIFELGSKCNLAKEHWGRCPSADPDRYGSLDIMRPITDEQIVLAAETANKMGFTGEIGFHYYNEPTLQWDRMQALKRKIRAAVPSQTFVLWTNGANLCRLEETKPEDQVRFADIVISDYFKKDWTWVSRYCDRLYISNGLLDGRRLPIRQATDVRCLRPFNELIFDNFGNAHLCCADWKGTSMLGSLHDHSFEQIAARFRQIRMALCRTTLEDPAHPLGIPAICARCRIKQPGLGELVPDVSLRARQALAQGAA